MKYVGIDVSKEKLDIFIRPDGKHFVIENNRDSLNKLAKKLRIVNPDLVAMESTGGYEKKLVKTLVKVGLKVSVVNAKLIKDFGRSGGARAKTDKLDSSVIAHYAEVHKPREVELPSDEENEMNELVSRRKQLVDMKLSESNRLSHAEGLVSKDIREHLDWLDKRIKEIDKILDEKIQKSEILNQKGKILMSVPGVGKVLSSVLLTHLPELGKFCGKKISALVGVAPFNRDSGKLRGQMSIFGGRKDVRSALYMPTWSAVKNNKVIKDFYNKLISKGKKPKVAITACMRKLLTILNSLIKKGINWNPEYIPENI